MIHFLPPCSITATARVLCVIVEFQWPWTVFSFLCRERWHLPEAGAVHLQHCLRDLSSWSGMYGSLPPQQVSDASQHHISRLGPRLCRKSTLPSWHWAQWNSKYESARGCFSMGSELCRKYLGQKTHVRFIIKEGVSQNVSHKTKSPHDARAETHQAFRERVSVTR